jgi:hypothetical protein
MTVPRWVPWWLAGAALGAVLLILAVRTSAVAFVGIIVVALLAIRSPERAAFGGGAIVLTGSVFLYMLRASFERCAKFDREARPIGGCSMFGVEDSVVAMALYLLVGLGLTAYAALRPRLRRA